MPCWDFWDWRWDGVGPLCAHAAPADDPVLPIRRGSFQNRKVRIFLLSTSPNYPPNHLAWVCGLQLCCVLPFAQTTRQRNRRFMHHSRYHPSLHDALTDFSRNMLACFQLPGTSKTRTDTNTPQSCLVCVVTRRSASKMRSTGKKGGQSATNGRQMARTSARETTSTLTTSRATSFCTCALSRREHCGLHSR